jgi:thioredoxin-dependent peroxiredoxin
LNPIFPGDHPAPRTLKDPASTGRNFMKILRVIDSLQLTAERKLATPANWNNGEDCIVGPAVSDADAEKKGFPRACAKSNLTCATRRSRELMAS